MSDDPDVSSRTAEMRYSYKTLWTHVKGVFSRPIELIGVVGGTAATVLALGDVPMKFVQLSIQSQLAFIAILTFFSVGVGLFWEIHQYMNECPVGFEDTPETARRLAHLQPVKWEFRLAQVLLASRLAPLDRECRDLLAGKVFVMASRPDDLMQYIRSMESRIDNALAMVDVAKHLLLHQLPDAVTSTEGKNASPSAILSAAEAIERFYRETVQFERASRSIIPPEGFERLHELQIGWAEPMRHGIQQMFRFLQQVIDTDPDADSNIRFMIEFNEPKTLPEFRAELGRLERQLGL